MSRSRRSLLTAGWSIATLFAGCLEREGPRTAAPTDTELPTATPTASASTNATPPHPDCETDTPVHPPDLSVRNGRSEAVTVEVAVTRGTPATATAPVYRERFSIPANGVRDVQAVFPTDDSYTVTATLSGETRVSKTFEIAADNRRQIIVVDVAESLTVGRLNVVPPATPTPCPE